MSETFKINSNYIGDDLMKFFKDIFEHEKCSLTSNKQDSVIDFMYDKKKAFNYKCCLTFIRFWNDKNKYCQMPYNKELSTEKYRNSLYSLMEMEIPLKTDVTIYEKIKITTKDNIIILDGFDYDPDLFSELKSIGGKLNNYANDYTFLIPKDKEKEFQEITYSYFGKHEILTKHEKNYRDKIYDSLNFDITIRKDYRGLCMMDTNQLSGDIKDIKNELKKLDIKVNNIVNNRRIYITIP